MTASFLYQSRKTPQDPFPNLRPPITVEVEDWNKFSRADLAEMFGGINRCLISRDCLALGFPERDPIDRDDIWKLYIMKMWQRKNPYAWRQTYVELIKDFTLEQEKEFIDEFVHAQGGSKKHCDELIESFIAKKKTRKAFA